MSEDSRRHRSLALVVGGLLVLASIEIGNALTQQPVPGLTAALTAGLLVFSLLAFAFLSASLLVKIFGAGRPAVLATVYVALTLPFAMLFLSWVTRWITGRPFNRDAVSILADSPVAATLHLLSSDPLLFLLVVGAFLGMLLGIAWMLHRALHAMPLLRTSTSTLLCLFFGSLASFSAREISATQVTPSSFATVLHADPQSLRITMAYTCPDSPDIPLEAPARRGDTGGVPVIVIMVESLRADLLQEYPDAIPNIKRLADEAMVFDRAYATASHSDYEDLAFWYSRYPLRADSRLGYPPDAPWRGLSVFEYFQLHGYSTAYFSSQNEKWGDMINWLKTPGVDTYFDSENFDGETWENHDDDRGLIALIRAGYARSGKVEDSKTLALAAQWIASHADRPFFMGLNLQNTHYHYFIPDGGARPFLPDELGFRAVYSAWPEDKAPVVRNRYLNAAYNLDTALGDFVAHLKQAGVWDKAAVLVVGDSGEAFYEHGFGNHSGPMYEEVARTLAVLKLPNGDERNGSHWRSTVSHIDFVPGLVELAGLPSWAGFQGISPWRRPTTAPVFMTVNAIVKENAILRWPWKLMVRTFPDDAVELYHLENDPTESHNAAQNRPAVTFELMNDLLSWRTCQVSYYADADAFNNIQPPRYHVDEPLRADLH